MDTSVLADQQLLTSTLYGQRILFGIRDVYSDYNIIYNIIQPILNLLLLYSSTKDYLLNT